MTSEPGTLANLCRETVEHAREDRVVPSRILADSLAITIESAVESGQLQLGLPEQWRKGPNGPRRIMWVAGDRVLVGWLAPDGAPVGHTATREMVESWPPCDAPSE